MPDWYVEQMPQSILALELTFYDPSSDVRFHSSSKSRSAPTSFKHTSTFPSPQSPRETDVADLKSPLGTPSESLAVEGLISNREEGEG